MTERYFLDEPPCGERARLVGPEAHHFLHVMRGTAGAEILVFDGGGAEYLARAVAATRSQVELQIVERLEADRELSIAITLGVSLPKGDRQRWLVEKVVELGVGRLMPLATQRGVAQPTLAALARLRRAVVEASKQCGRNKLLEIAPATGWAAWLESAPPGVARALAHPCSAESDQDRQTPATFLRRLAGASEVWFAVGPEGGFTDQEVTQATAAGWDLIDLGPRILRVETAAVFLAGLATAVQVGVCAAGAVGRPPQP
jgi:16S rRNA (uracil1498-N3)-methyltransferase